MRYTVLTLLLSAISLLPSPASAREDAPAAFEGIDEAFATLLERGDIVGGQFSIAMRGEPGLSRAYGVRALDSEEPVTPETLFLIASCSKPFASTCVLRLASDPGVDLSLHDSINRWLPDYRNLPIAGGTRRAKRAPTVEELLCHRGGIYSQKVKITPEQSRLLYSFDETLETRVGAIATHALLAPPNTRYAYSGAGYCVLGRAAEVAAGKPFETILQEQVCTPLGLERTTYFPHGKFDNIATGFMAGRAPHKLGENHLFPLIGGSLYSTAADMQRFARGACPELAERAAGLARTNSGAPLIDEKMWTAMEVVRNTEGGYSLGWKTHRKNLEIVRLSHSGSLQGYRSFLIVDRHTGISAAATWTLPNRHREKDAGSAIKTALTAALNQ